MMKQKNIIRIIVVSAALIVPIVAYYFGVGALFTAQNLKANRHFLLTSVNRHYFLAVLMYIASYILITATSIPGALVLTHLGGFLFGMPAVLYVVIGATLGATAAFFIIRYAIGSLIQEKYHASLVYFNKQIEQRGALFLLIVRLIPIIPFFLINALAGLTTISARTFIVTTAIGIIPGVFINVLSGSRLAQAQNIRDIFSWPIILAISVIIFSIILAKTYNPFKIQNN